LLNLMILGSPRSGTTSLGYYMMEHPEIYHIRQRDFEPTVGYQANYPYNDPFTTRRTQEQTSEIYKHITPEKKHGKKNQDDIKYIMNRAVYSIYHPHIIYNLFEQQPNSKFVLCLRNPIDTMFSTYCALSTGTGVRGAIDRPEEDRLTQTFEEWLLADYDLNRDPSTVKLSELSNRLLRGVYYPGVSMLMKLVPRENVYVIPFEKHTRQTKESMRDLCGFLSIDQDYEFQRLSIRRGETKKPVPMKSETREWLAGVFESSNTKLFNLLDWSEHQWT